MKREKQIWEQRFQATKDKICTAENQGNRWKIGKED